MPKFNDFDSFIREHIGKSIGSTPFSIDLIKSYLNEVYDIEPIEIIEPYKYFEEFYNTGDVKNKFIKMVYREGFIPKKGDIAIWNTNIKENGHIAICDGAGDAQEFYSYDQCWESETDVCRRIKHTYDDLYGVLRPKQKPAGRPDITLYKEEPKEKVTFDSLLEDTGAPATNSLFKEVEPLVNKPSFKLKVDLKVRCGPAVTYPQTPYKNLTFGERNKAYKRTYAVLKKGSIITVEDIITKSEDESWARIESGYICLSQNGSKYAVEC